MTRAAAIERAEQHFDTGAFKENLARRIAIPSTSQEEAFRPDLYRYLDEEMRQTLSAMGYEISIHENPVAHGGPFLIARRVEDPNATTVLTYGHGDVVRGQEEDWAEGLEPWALIEKDDRWYGRGIADNKGQHSTNIAALQSVIAERGKLGFNSTILLEMSEEIGSPGLDEFAKSQRDALRADVLISSDGPRLHPDRPTLFMGTRGAMNFELEVNLREGAHHSGNWGGLISNAGTRLATALATIVGPKGEILVPALKPEEIPASVREVLKDIEAGGAGPAVEPDWGEPGLSPAERVFAWNAFEILAFETGNPARPTNAIPPAAKAWCQIRFTVDRDPNTFLPALREHLDTLGYQDVEIVFEKGFVMNATRLLPDNRWVQFARQSFEETDDRKTAILPNLGGSLPNAVFAETLQLPTIWAPLSYTGCAQHAPNEHLPPQLLREGLRLMTGLFWDVGAQEV